jgi:tRNA G10  N-methylase Trm11
MPKSEFSVGLATMYHSDCVAWLQECEEQQFHAVVTDPPYGVIEYSAVELAKLRAGSGGVWRIPPSFDGHQRSPLPRFTTLTQNDLVAVGSFFVEFAEALLPTLVPGAHVMLASNPLVSFIVSTAFAEAGYERRGEIARLVQTMRGGDRPKGAHEEFPDVSTMPRSQWEPWLLFRKPFEGRVQDNLRKYGTGGLRRISETQPFGDVIRSSPTSATERALAGHPSLKPQNFLRQMVRASLPTGSGIVLDPFAGSGSTLAAANVIGYDSIGVELDAKYFQLAKTAIPALEKYKNGTPPPWTI